MTYEEIVTALAAEFDGVGSEFSDHHHEELEGGWYFCITNDGNPFTEGSVLVPTRSISLSGRDTKDRTLMRGEYSLGSGWVAIWQETEEAYGQFIDIPDEHEISVWVGPKENACGGRARILADHDAILASEVDRDLCAIEKRLMGASSTLPENARELILSRLTAVTRNIL